MVKWTITNSSFNTTSGIASSEQDVVLTISPTTGYSIEAKNFKVGEGVETNGSMVGTSGTDIWEASGGVFWNADSNISKVVFTNVAQGGGYPNPNNTVLATITVTSFTPSAAASLYLDIDERDDNPIAQTGEEPRDICLKARWGYSANQTVTVTGLGSTVSSEVIDTGSVSGEAVERISGTVPNGASTAIATIKFEAAGGYRFNISGNFPGTFVFPGTFYPVAFYENAYYFSVDSVTVTGNFTELTYTIYYTPPVGLDDSEDALGHTVCTLSHELDLASLIIAPIPSVPSGGGSIHNVTYESNVGHDGGRKPIKVFGTVGAGYSISVQKKTSTTSIVTAGTNGYYNFETGGFQTAETSFESTIGSRKVTSHSVDFPKVTDETRYDITISGLVEGVTSIMSSRVPTLPGDAIILQRGVNVLTIKPITYSAPANFGSMPSDVTIAKRQRFMRDGYTDTLLGKVQAKGGTGGVSSTRLVLSTLKAHSRVTPGMIVTGAGVAHGVTVKAINGHVVTLSAVSTVAASTDISFINSNGIIVPFSFTIVPNPSAHALTVNASAILKDNFGGLTGVKNQINGTAAKTITHTLDSTKGIVPGMVVTGSEVFVAAGTDLTVASVTSGTVIVLSEKQSFVDNAGLKFSGGNAAGKTKIYSIQANKVGSNIVITGYVDSTGLEATAEARLYIDDIITVTP